MDALQKLGTLRRKLPTSQGHVDVDILDNWDLADLDVYEGLSGEGFSGCTAELQRGCPSFLQTMSSNKSPSGEQEWAKRRAEQNRLQHVPLSLWMVTETEFETNWDDDNVDASHRPTEPV